MSDFCFGERLQLVLKLQGLTQKEASKRSSISENAFVNYVKGRRVPAGAILEKITQLCGVSIEYLVSGTINENYCYEVLATIQLNQLNLNEVASKLNVPEKFLIAITEKQVSPSTEFFNKIMQAIGVKPQGDLKDRVEESVARYGVGGDGEIEMLRIEVKRLNEKLREYMEALGESQMENRILKNENEQLKRKLQEGI